MGSATKASRIDAEPDTRVADLEKSCGAARWRIHTALTWLKEDDAPAA